MHAVHAETMIFNIFLKIGYYKKNCKTNKQMYENLM